MWQEKLLAGIQDNRDKSLIISIYIITLSESWFLINRKLNFTFECIGYGVLLFSICVNFLYKSNYKRVKRNAGIFIVVSILMSCGFLIQELSLKRKIILLLTVVAIAMVSILAENYMDSLDLVRKGAYAILSAVATACVLGILGGDQIIEKAAEGGFGIEFGICGGMQFKNYFAADMLAAFTGIYFYNKFVGKRKKDKITLWITGILILLSNSRGGWILYITFLATSKYTAFRKIRKEYRKGIAILAGIIAMAVCIWFCNRIMLNSGTYMLRIRGVINYAQHYAEDIFHLLFGNAENVYDKKENYVLTVRSIVGWNGSLEMALLNIVIKSGILGLFGYGIIYIRILKNAFCSDNWVYKEIVISIVLTMLVSSFVEPYIQSVHCIYAIFGYMVVIGLYNSKSIESNRQIIDVEESAEA